MCPLVAVRDYEDRPLSCRGFSVPWARPGAGRDRGARDGSRPGPSLPSQPSRALFKALDRAGQYVDQVDLSEINEAFASVAIQSMRDLDSGADMSTSTAARSRWVTRSAPGSPCTWPTNCGVVAMEPTPQACG